MKKTHLPLISSLVLLSSFAAAFAAPQVQERSALDRLLAQLPSPEAVAAAPAPSAPAEATPDRYVAPPCVPSQALLPGRDFLPKVSDERRVKAIDDLLARIAVCKPMPYQNDGVIHTDPHAGLPVKPAGWYKEYTLIVPDRPTGSKPEPVVIGGHTYMTGPVLSPRGPERLMIGNNREVYYTPDHYTTFVYLAIVR